ncbi:ABC transporter permease subunit [Caldicellulosiruptor naganoensis]|uniref:ABC transporter permease subunit n=1 Tax=Caldicellulosiruptor naganoensis TaxID=29324 RepID=A0ABY7BGW9_9FIRM|nr:ABC transporter permease subunit [Caldicellulosiruptor naganoensis]WAM31715.1 ABC transporter permease subunit [Caldicellulosiruptor naganoensis]
MLLYAEIQKILKSKKFFIALIITIGFNLFYCWFVYNYENKSVESTKQYIADTERQIKELQQKLKKEKDDMKKRLYQEQINELNRIVQKEKLKMQYASNPKKEIEERARYYKMRYEISQKAGDYKELEINKVNYQILNENIKRKKYYSVGGQFDGWTYLLSQSYGIAFFIIIVLALLIGSGIVSDEYKEGTAKILKTMPVKRSNIILSKFIATVLTVSALVIGIQIVFFIVLNLITDSFKYYDVYCNWISRYKVIGFKVYPVLDNVKLLTLLESSILQFMTEIVIILAISGIIVFFSSIFENGVFTSISFIAIIVIISILRQKMLMIKTPVLKLLSLIFPWELSVVYTNYLPNELDWIYASTYVVIGLNLLLTIIFVLGSIEIFKHKEKV